MKISERLYESCRAIIECVSKEENSEIREIKLKDLLHRYDLLKDELEANGNNGNVITTRKEEKKKFDIGIFTVVSVEFEQFKSILPFDEEKSAELPDINGLDYFVAEIKRENGAPPLSVLVTLIGFAGNVSAAIACMRTFRRYDLGLSIICGIGAGVKGEIEKYSVVVSDGVFDYESQRLEENRITYRSDPIDIDEYHKRRFGYLSTIQSKWKDDYLRYAELNLIDPSDFNIAELGNAKIKNGLIASGGKLLADGKTIQTLRETIQIKKGVLAAEMEGSGFASVCREFKKDWLIFRGISDLGEGEGDKDDPKNKKYQKIAAAAAAKAVFYYLSFLYTKPEERDIDF